MSTRLLLIFLFSVSAAAPAGAQAGVAEQLAGLATQALQSEDRQVMTGDDDGGGQASASADPNAADARGPSIADALLHAARWGAFGGAIGAGAATLAAGAWVMAGGALIMRSVGCCAGPAPGLDTMMMATPFVGLALIAMPAVVTGLVLFAADAGVGAIVAGAAGASAVFIVMLPMVALSTVLMATASYQHFGGGGTRNGYGLDDRQIGGSALVLAVTSVGAGVVSGVLTAGVAAGGALLDVTLQRASPPTEARPSELE